MNLTALESRFLRICWSRFESLIKVRGRSASKCTWNGRFLFSATCRKLRSMVSRRPANEISSTSTVTVPDSIFERSRMSLIKFKRSEPDEWTLRAKSTCLGKRLPPALSASCWLRMRIELSGVRSSCDMLARNSDLYLEVRASSAAFSSSARRACSTSRFLSSTSAFCSASSLALVPSSSLVCCSSLWRDWSSTVNCCDCLSRPSVRIVASIVLSTTPMLVVS